MLFVVCVTIMIIVGVNIGVHNICNCVSLIVQLSFT